MRRLVITALSALILMCVTISNPQGRGLRLIGWTPLMTSLLWVGTPPAQASASEGSAAQSAQDSISLEPGKPVERELSGGGSHSYKITMVSGQYSHIVVEQRGIDVAVTLFTPDGKKISEANNEQSIEGSETLSVIAEASGAYLIEARSPEKTAKAGRYEIKVEEMRAATAEDKHRVAAWTIFQEAKELQDGSPDAKRKSIEKYQEALELYRRAGDRDGEAQALNNISEIYWVLGEKQRALGLLNEALLIRRAVGNRKEEATTLTNMGVVYLSLGEMQKALEKFNEALPICRAIGDRRGEADTLNQIGRYYLDVEEMQKALEKYNEALQIRQALGDRMREASTLTPIGSVYWSLRTMQEA